MSTSLFRAYAALCVAAAAQSAMRAMSHAGQQPAAPVDPIAAYQSAVNQAMASGASRTNAICQVRRAQPDLIDRYNTAKRRQ